MVQFLILYFLLKKLIKININISEKLKKFYKKIKFQSNIILFFIFKIKK